MTTQEDEDSDFKSSVTLWIQRVKDGDQIAADKIWTQYYDRLIRLANRHLQTGRNRAADEEDAVVAAFAAFFQRAEEGYFPDLNNRDDLWRLLVTMTKRQALDQLRHERRQKRGGGQVRGGSVFMKLGSSDGDTNAGFEGVADDEPTPAMAVMLTDSLRDLLKWLDQGLQEIVVLKLQGYQNQEIAEQLACSERTIERRLDRIRKKWQSVYPGIEEGVLIVPPSPPPESKS